MAAVAAAATAAAVVAAIRAAAAAALRAPEAAARYFASDFTNVDLATGGANNAAYSGNGYVTIDFVAAAVPEPGSLGLLAAGLFGFGLARRRPRST